MENTSGQKEPTALGPLTGCRDRPSNQPTNQPGEMDSKEIRWKSVEKSCKIRNPHNIKRCHVSHPPITGGGLLAIRTFIDRDSGDRGHEICMKKVRCDDAGRREATSIKERVLGLDTPTLAGQSLGTEYSSLLLQPACLRIHQSLQLNLCIYFLLFQWQPCIETLGTIIPNSVTLGLCSKFFLDFIRISWQWATESIIIGCWVLPHSEFSYRQFRSPSLLVVLWNI